MKDKRVNYQGCPVLYFDEEPVLTEQHHKDDCDINSIMSKFASNPSAIFADPSAFNYSDVSEHVDYHSALNFVRRIDDMFIQIPADIREKFDNDPEKFVDFMNDENNISALQDMGILVKKDSISSPKETLNANEVSEAP